MNPLEAFRQKVAAGEESFDAQGLQRLTAEFEDLLSQAFERAEDAGQAGEWVRIFKTLFDASLARPVAALVKLDVFRNFGLRLPELTTNGEVAPLIHYYLELLRLPEFLIRLKETKPYESLILRLIRHSRFTVGVLLRLRAALYGDRNWLGQIQGPQVSHYTFAEAREQADQFARGLMALIGRHPKDKPAVAFLSDNSPQMALLDLACLSSGIVNVMIPANSVSSQIAFILNQTQAKVLLVGRQKHLMRVNEVRRQLESVEKVIMINEPPQEQDVLSLNDLLRYGLDVSDDALAKRRAQMRVDDLATVMYTSGTTGEPKGIMFSQLNIIYKRFCRALALPEIGPDDRFLAYLPLYHTFGRYLEMTGSLFWGAEYYFMENPAVETIAPQRIEKFFYDFDYVRQAFLIGDNRPFNTVLLYPDFEGENNPLKKMNRRELHDLFTSVVVTVNNFLAPFERIVDFRITDRPFSAEFGELTPKGTYKRKVIEKNFSDIIESMYRRSFVEFPWHQMTVRLPNWFLREQGYLTQDVRISEQGLIVEKEHLTLPMAYEAEKLVRIGRYRYAFKTSVIDLQVLLYNPLYWLGNQELIDFSAGQVFQWYRLDQPDANVQFTGSVAAIPVSVQTADEVRQMIGQKELTLKGLHFGLLLLQSNEPRFADLAVDYFKLFLSDSRQPFRNLVKEIIRNPAFSTGIYNLRQQFRLGLQVFKGAAFKEFFERFLQAEADFLNGEIIAEIAGELAGDAEVLRAVFALIRERIARLTPGADDQETVAPVLFDLLAQIGIEHPSHYKEVRQWLVRYQLRKDCKALARSAAKSRRKLLAGFCKWIGQNQQISIDMETGKEYRWQDVMIFDEAISERDRAFLLNALSSRPIIREALFLLGGGLLVGLYDIPPGGVWISQLHQEADHTVYRVSVQTRFQGGFDFVINLERNKATRLLKEEMNWLIHACALAGGMKLVEEFGGFWKEFNLWTEEYIPGDSLRRYFRKMMRRDTEETRLRLHYLWPMFIWTGISAYVSFWRRTGYRLEISDISPDNIMIPPHDYLSGVRIFPFASARNREGCLR